MRRALLLALVALLCLPVGAQAAGPLITAVAEPGAAGADGPVLLGRVHEAGARTVRLYISWRGTAPGGTTKPAGFDARNPADPMYDWSGPDTAIKAAVAAGLEPLVSVARAPLWAERPQPGDENLPAAERIPGTLRPDPVEFGLFGEAIARRYSGTFQGLPRVRRWQAWNEPNHHNDLNPQFEIAPDQNATASTKMVAPEMYRDLLNAFSSAVHMVRSDNIVGAAGLAPFFRPAPGGRAAAPLPFMRQMLCLTSTNKPRKGCTERSIFDAWAQHPYTSGNAWHSANSPDDVSLGDLGVVRKTLDAAQDAGRITSRGRVRFWVTEFSWDSNPPDRFGVPSALLTRWVAEAMHQMWRHGVELVTWFQVRDDVSQDEGGIFQSGLYLRCDEGVACDRPKPMLTSFRFPFTAYKARTRVRLWGRTPGGSRGTVTVQQRRTGRWVRLGRLKTDRHGIFRGKLRRRGGGVLRARLGKATTASFSLKRPPDRAINPFGNFPVDETR